MENKEIDAYAIMGRLYDHKRMLEHFLNDFSESGGRVHIAAFERTITVMHETARLIKLRQGLPDE